jgi:hypothetical protein
VLDAVRGGIGPAAGQVEPDRAARPDDLVVHDVAARAGWREAGLVGDHLPQPGEGAGLELLPARLLAMPQDSGAEHLVVDQLHRIVLLVKAEVGQGGGGGKGARGRFQVQAEEHAPAEVLEHRHQAGIAQPGALS